MNKVFALAAILSLLCMGVSAQAALQAYSIIDCPIYQIDTTTGLVDHVSGIIMADSATGAVNSASFTITGNGISYTVASAAIDANVFVHISPTQITLTQSNPSNPLGYGNLRLSGSTGLTGSNSTAVMQWYCPGNPWVPGSMPFAGYTGTVGSKGSGPLFASGGPATYPWVVATAVPEPSSLLALVSGVGLLVGLRRRRS